MADRIDTTRLTNEVGNPVADNNHTLTAGERGPMMLQDNWMIEKLAHFDREVIPERRMHAKGSGAYGTFKVTGDISKYTKAKVLQPGAETEVFVRFSTVAGERGAADAERDIRGFAMKFYTPDGNWDLVGNNTPVFFLRDPKKFIDLNHVVKRDPHTNMHSAQSNWDFWSSLPEALHQVTIVMSDRGIPASYRHMHGFGSHTFSLINEDNERVWVKFHLKTNQGIKNLTDAEAGQIIAGDRESHQRDLFNAIERGEFPSWRFCVQIMDEATAKNYKENPFDITKTWSQKEFPLIEVGTLELNRNPENYFAEVEQAAFAPTHLVPGIGLSPDKLLQGRLFAYGDAQRYRLGVNHNHIPVNRPLPLRRVPSRRHDAHRRQLRRYHRLRAEQLRAVAAAGRRGRAAAGPVRTDGRVGSRRRPHRRHVLPAGRPVSSDGRGSARCPHRQHGAQHGRRDREHPPAPCGALLQGRSRVRRSFGRSAGRGR